MPSTHYYRRLKMLHDFASSQYPANRFIFTCRTLHHDEMLDYETVVLVDLEQERVRLFLDAYLDESILAQRAYASLKASPTLASTAPGRTSCRCMQQSTRV